MAPPGPYGDGPLASQAGALLTVTGPSLKAGPTPLASEAVAP